MSSDKKPAAGGGVIPADIVKERLKASYDAMAPAYNKWTIPHSEGRMRYLEKALAQINNPSPNTNQQQPVFVELGCGCGLPVTEALLRSPHNAKVIANDISETQIKLARENLAPLVLELSRNVGEEEEEDAHAPSLQLVQGDMLDSLDKGVVILPDASVDLVVAFYSIIHLPREEQEVLFTCIARWLKPGGRFVANFAAEEIESAVIERWLDQDKGWMFWSGWGVESTLEKLREVGLVVEIADVKGDVVDESKFLWVVAKRLEG